MLFYVGVERSFRSLEDSAWIYDTDDMTLEYVKLDGICESGIRVNNMWFDKNGNISANMCVCSPVYAYMEGLYYNQNAGILVKNGSKYVYYTIDGRYYEIISQGGYFIVNQGYLAKHSGEDCILLLHDGLYTCGSKDDCYKLQLGSIIPMYCNYATIMKKYVWK